MLKTTRICQSTSAKDEIVESADVDRSDKTVKNLSKFKKLKNNKFKNQMHFRATKKLIFLAFGTPKALNCLKQ